MRFLWPCAPCGCWLPGRSPPPESSSTRVGSLSSSPWPSAGTSWKIVTQPFFSNEAHISFTFTDTQIIFWFIDSPIPATNCSVVKLISFLNAWCLRPLSLMLILFLSSSVGGLILDKTVTNPNFVGMAVFTPVINGKETSRRSCSNTASCGHCSAASQSGTEWLRSDDVLCLSGVGGNLVAVQASRISTYLHINGVPMGDPNPTSRKCPTPCTSFFSSCKLMDRDAVWVLRGCSTASPDSPVSFLLQLWTHVRPVCSFCWLHQDTSSSSTPSAPWGGATPPWHPSSLASTWLLLYCRYLRRELEFWKM